MSPRSLAVLATAIFLSAAEGPGLPNPAFLAPYSGAKEYAVRSMRTSVSASYWVAAPAAEVSAHHRQLLEGAGFRVTLNGAGGITGTAKNQAATVRIQQSDLGTNVSTRYATGAPSETLMSQARAAEAAANVTAAQAYAWPRFLVPPPGDEFPRPPEVSSNPRTGERVLKLTFGTGEDLQTVIAFYERLFAYNGLAVCCTAMNTAKTLSGKTAFKSGHVEGSQSVIGGHRKVVVNVDRSNMYGYFQVTLEVKVRSGM